MTHTDGVDVPRRWPRTIAMAASIAVLAATAVTGTGGLFAKYYASNIAVGDDGNWTNTGARPTPGDPINIVLMGSDTREGRNEGKGYGNTDVHQGARSDTTIVVHISGDRTRAIAVSIPRDSIVTIPTCVNDEGVTVGPSTEKFNAAFNYGGPGCTVKTIESLTGLTIDHYAVVDFTGFKKVVDTLDGVEVCVNKPVSDWRSKLELPAGPSTIRGEQALAFVRARYSLGDGGDLGRIERQQQFLSSAIRKATSMGIVLNPLKLHQVLDSVSRTLTVDAGLASTQAMQELAINVSGMSPSDITFATVPVMDNNDFSSYSWIPSQANQLWNAIKYDQPWPPMASVAQDGEPLFTAPADVSVKVVNRTGDPEAGERAAEQLRSEGFVVTNVSDASPRERSRILRNAGMDSQLQAARTLGFATGVEKTANEPYDWTSTVTLVVGADYRFEMQPVKVTPQVSRDATKSSKSRTADTDICAEV